MKEKPSGWRNTRVLVSEPIRASIMAATGAPAATAAPANKQLEDKAVWEGVEEELPDDIKNGSAEDVVKATRLLENEIKSLKNEVSRLNLEHKREKERIKENNEKIKLNKQLPYLVGNVVEVRV
jgi:26S proteasome regulatory subunit T5